MKFYVAKVLQLIGITTVGFGLMYGLTHEEGLRYELNLLMAGSAFFLVGRFIEGRGAA